MPDADTHEVHLEIEGMTAMWTRADTGDSPVSYPAPTYSAVKGIFESVLWLKTAEVVPQQVEICSPIVFHNYTTNYGGPLRKSKVKEGSYQLVATVLINVCYKLHAIVINDWNAEKFIQSSDKKRKTTNAAHAYKAIFQKNLERGLFYTMPCLGWKEFVPSYVGPLRQETTPQSDINLTIPSMFKTGFPNGKYTAWQPVFTRDVHIVDGVLTYAQ